MSSQHPEQPPPSPQSIPLQNLARPPGEHDQDVAGRSTGATAPTGLQPVQRISPPSPSPSMQRNSELPGLMTYWEQPQGGQQEPGTSRPGHVGSTPSSPIDPAALQFALPPEIHPPHPSPGQSSPNLLNPYAMQTTYYDEPSGGDYFDSDSAPLTASAQPISGAHTTRLSESQPRSSFQTVSDLDGAQSPKPRDTKMLGFDLGPDFESNKHRSYGNSPYAHGQAMSQRVVNISGEAETLEQQQQRRSRSRSPSADGRRSQLPPDFMGDTSYQSQVYPTTPLEKAGGDRFTFAPEPPMIPRRPMPNPLKGRSLGIFSPDNPIRKRLCDVLVNPYMEPFILILIVLQTILLAVEAAPNVHEEGNHRPERWGGNAIDWAMLVLFIIFTIELIARIIVSGFVLNATEYSTIDRGKGVKKLVSERYEAVFKPQRQKSVKSPTPREDSFGPHTFARSFTMMHGQRLPETVEEAQRMQLARRAFLRHGFNRLDFVAVVSFWITFALSITGIEAEHRIWIFRMLSCLRIVRLLALTNGTSIILRSLKKATPLLLRVSFLILFFWILFAIIGIQSFKTSLSRQCVWVDPEDPNNLTAAYTNDEVFCGGHLDPNGTALPWVRMRNDNFSDRYFATTHPKGFICPKGSLCLLQESPYNNTVNFDNIYHSLELVFVLMSANTWSDLMYWTSNSDYLTSALFFGAGIMIMMLWMTNLLIAVITSSFQVIREESKSSAFTSSQEPLMGVVPDQDRLQRTSTLQKLYDKTSIIWVLLITLDLVTQAWRSSRMPESRATFIHVVEIIVTSLLDIEIAIRIAANWRGFHRNYRNLFDLFLAVATTIIILPPIHNSGQVYAWLSGFQILRIYRVVLAIPITRKLILLVLGNAAGIANLLLFVFLITFIMAIFSVQIFRGELPLYKDGELNRISFYNIYNAFLGMYQILSSENWTEILYNVTSYTTSTGTSWYGSMFLIGWFILAFFILVNMFIAVIQENFDVSEDEKRLEQVKAFLQRKELGSNQSNLALSTIFTFGKTRRKKDPLDYGPATMEMLLKDAVVREFLDDSLDPLQQASADGQSPQQGAGAGDVRPGLLSGVWSRLRSFFIDKDPNPFYSNIRFNGPNETLDPRQMAREAVSATSTRRKAQREYLARHPTYNNALYIFTPKNPIRRMCQRLVGPGRGNERFDGVEPNKIAWYTFSAFIYAAIVAMVVLACVTTPLYQKEYFETHSFKFSNWFVWVDMGFAVVFTIEAIIKIVADGFFFTPNAYFRSSWGFIDGIVLITLWINVLTLFANDGAVSRAIGAFKALRALRLLNISDTARQTFHSLVIVSIWKILGAAFVSVSLLIPFAIYALNLFNGLLVQCNDGDVGNLSECFGEYEATPFNEDWSMLAPRVAANPFYSFDDFGSSMFILFQIVSQEGWTDVSFSVQAITGRGEQPSDLAAPGNAMFLVVFNILATVFILTLFISIFMRNYTEQTGVAFLTAEQRSWLELRKLLRQISPSKSSYDDSERKWKKWCHKRAIEKRGKWYTAITGVLVFHLILLMAEFEPEPDWWTRTRDILFVVFTFTYMANIIIRIVGLGWARFRRSSWDMFSLIAVTGALATSFLNQSNRGHDTYNQLHKFFLVAIVLLLIPRNDALDQLFKTAAASLTTIVNLLATWLVFFLVFAIAFTQTFSLTRFGGSEDANLNFRTVPKALVMMFRMSTGEGWNEIMEDFATIEPPFCVKDAEFFDSDCGSTAWARGLFIGWNIVSMYLFVNLFISLIYESFSYVYQRSSGLPSVDRDEIRRFKEAWRSVDPAGTGFISKEQFPRLLGELSGIFTMRIYEPEDSVRSILEDVRNDPSQARHTSIASGAASTSAWGVDIGKLNARLNQIDVQEVRNRRRRFNVFFEEVMVSADPDRGISFTTVLMILAHYNIISDSKSLRLEEFLRRRARLQRVEEEVRRRVVLGFFDTLYWARKFKRHIDKKKSGRMTAVPQLDVPDIFVEDEDQRLKPPQRSTMAVTPQSASRSSEFLGASNAARPLHKSWNSNVDTGYDSSSAHPLSEPRARPSRPRHDTQVSAFSFELQEPGTSSAANSRRGSSVSPAQVRELLDDSVWVESIRRSATIRKSVRKTDWSAY
ncbi:calcium channel subunit cch1 [Apiospora hydei]|uniref:Calcium channel subunit cch1 n=1 Tax=Apiospora hydei TaxID=1337664 RepID=A0ABR1X129_9PEZI